MNFTIIASTVLSLVESDWSDKLAVDMIETEWHCSNCGIQSVMTSIEKLQHQSTCFEKNLDDRADDQRASTQPLVQQKPNSQAYDCLECNKTMYLTPIEILRHKKQHL